MNPTSEIILLSVEDTKNSAEPIFTCCDFFNYSIRNTIVPLKKNLDTPIKKCSSQQNFEVMYLSDKIPKLA